MVGAALMGLSFDVFGVLWQTTMQREIPPESLSRVSSYDAFGSVIFGPVGLLLAGPAAVLIGAHTALIWCAVIVVLTAVAALTAPGSGTSGAAAEPETTGAQVGSHRRRCDWKIGDLPAEASAHPGPR